MSMPPTSRLFRIATARAFLVDVRPAGEVIPSIGEALLHAGPPLSSWTEACGALRGAVAGTLLQLDKVASLAAADAAATNGAVELRPANDSNALATYGGVISARTPLLVVENRDSGVQAFAALNEGRGRALRYGANDADTLARLAWLEGEFAELLGAAVRLCGALHMGDDGHSRQKAASAVFFNAIAPFIVEANSSKERTTRALRFIARNEIFLLPMTMAAAKCALASAAHIPTSTVVTCMCVNGVRFGIKVSGLGDRWCTAPLPTIHGQYFDNYGARGVLPRRGSGKFRTSRAARMSE